MSDANIYKKILILGNGFDLAHNLPTKYVHFMEFCKKVHSFLSLPKSPAETKEWFARSFDSWDFHKQVKVALKEALMSICSDKNEKESDIAGYVRELYECIEGNTWYRFFNAIIKENLLIGKNWIDFESEISSVIRILDKNIDSLDKNYGTSSFKHDNNNFGEFISDRSLFLKQVTTGRELRERCYVDLEKLTRALEIYLSCFVEKIQCDGKDIIFEIEPDHVLNFNYTNTYERIYGMGEVFHIHGVCKKERFRDDNNMVLGIDEYLTGNEKNENTNFSIFKKFVQRIRKHTGNDCFEWLDETKEDYEIQQSKIKYGLADANTEVYVFGHSLDKTDKDILREFFWTYATRVIIYCKDKGTQGDLIENMIKIIDQERLLKKVNTSPARIEFVIQK